MSNESDPAVTAEVAQFLADAEAADWPALRANLDAARAVWEAAWSSISAEQADAQRDGEWSAREVGSHVAAALLRVTDTLANLAVAAAPPSTRERLLPGDPAHARVSAALQRGWEHLSMATTTAGKIPDPGAVIASPLGPLSMKQLAAIAADHIEQHAAQILAMPDQASEGEPMADEAAIMRARIQEEASRASWADLLGAAEAMRAEWLASIEGLSAAESPAGPQDGEWSPWHLVNHVGAWMEAATNALERATQDESTNLGSDQAFYQDEPSFEEARERVARYVDTFVAQIEACGAGVQDDVRVTHRILGEISAPEYAVLATGHVNSHSAQMREMRGMAG